MGLRRRRLSVAARMLLALIVVFAELTYSVETEAVLDGSLSFHEFEDRMDYGDEEGEISYGIKFACKDEGEDDDCPLPVTEEVISICLYGCWSGALLPVLSDDVHRVT